MKKNAPRHVIIKLLKTSDKEKIFKLPKKKDIISTKEQRSVFSRFLFRNSASSTHAFGNGLGCDGVVTGHHDHLAGRRKERRKEAFHSFLLLFLPQSLPTKQWGWKWDQWIVGSGAGSGPSQNN